MAKIIEINKSTQMKDIIKALDETKAKPKNSYGNRLIEKILYDADEKTLVATDGKRMLTVKTNLLELAGVDYNATCIYNRNMLIVEEYKDTLLDWRRVIPIAGSEGYEKAIEINAHSNTATSWILFNLARQNVMVDHHFMDSIESILHMFSHLTWNGNKEFAPILLMDRDDSIKYVMMPCNHCEEARIVDARELL